MLFSSICGTAGVSIKRTLLIGGIPDCPRWTFRLDEIDRQIADIDACDSVTSFQGSISSGPFGVFRAAAPILEGSQEPDLGLDSTSEPDASVTWDFPAEIDDSSQYGGMEAEAPTEEQSPGSVNWQLQVMSPRREASPFVYRLNSSLFRDPVIHRLMDNYIHTVANLLPPLPHPENPYASIYVPKAMYGASNLLLGVGYSASEVSPSNVAIFYALLATSAFHLRGADTEDAAELDLTARRFRAKAFASLQKALQEPAKDGGDRALPSPSSTPSSHGEAVISAMLTLITTDVSSALITLEHRSLANTVLRQGYGRFDERVLDSSRGG